ncbi:hypothetical protein GW7_18266 [Heterocephalus glaber]|uniref:Protein HEATR9 n=1 Tax=Heterocephalus glaber TaxID=10181 RepID=G5B744_HETGA|nr:hypothetical protein GW7_18266 [Heterocephalus glaber]
MADEKLVDIFEISRMFMYPWLEYPDRTKEFRKAMAPVHLPLSCYKTPKEELPPSPEHWRQHLNKPNAVPYCYSKKPEIYTHWHTLYDQRKEQETQKMLLKMRGHPEYALSTSIFSTSSRKNRKALGYHGINDKFIMKALWQVAQTGPKKVKYEAYRTLAILGCLNMHVIQALIKQLKEESEGHGMETLTRLRVALNSWAAVPEDKRTQVGNEEELVLVLQTLIKSSGEAALEAALCLGFLRPRSNMAQEFLLQCLCQGTKTQQMKALRMLVKIMHVHSAVVTRAILAQICCSSVIEDRFEATQMLRTIGLEKIKAQGLEKLTFDLLKWKTHYEPFGVLGICGPQVFHLLLDMLDAEENQAVKKNGQHTTVEKKKNFPDFPFHLSKPQKQKPQTIGPWHPKIRQQLWALAEIYK